jgi:hypothetical protein
LAFDYRPFVIGKHLPFKLLQGKLFLFFAGIFAAATADIPAGAVT